MDNPHLLPNNPARQVVPLHQAATFQITAAKFCTAVTVETTKDRQCVCPLCWSVHSNLVRDGNRLKQGGGVGVHPPSSPARADFSICPHHLSDTAPMCSAPSSPRQTWSEITTFPLHFQSPFHSGNSILYTAKTQYRKFETNVPRKGIPRPQSQFPHSCVCERFIFSHDRSAYSAAGKYVDRSWEYINRSQKCGNQHRGRAIPFLVIHKWDFLCSVDSRQ